MVTVLELRAAAIALYRQRADALLKGDTAAAADLKLRADFLSTVSMTGYRMPAFEALALGR